MTHDATGSRTSNGPLTGVMVVDMTRLAPGPYCTMLLADLGADVVVVGGGRSSLPVPEFSRGKRHVSLDLKQEAGRRALHALVRRADVFVEGFRPGVSQRLGAGYEELSSLNPALVYCSLTGYGQRGPRSQEAGHDINYIGVTGVLGSLGPADREPYPPLNIVADFAGGSLVAAFGIVSALFDRGRSGRGRYVDAAMIDGCLSLMAMHLPLWKTALMPGRGDGLIVGNAPFYRCYPCADGRHVSVGALEPAFFAALWNVLKLGDPPDHMDKSNWPLIERELSARFLSKKRDEWAAVFAGSDACVAPVLAPDEVWSDPQIRERHPGCSTSQVPAVPRFSGMSTATNALDLTDRTCEVLAEAGLAAADIDAATPKQVESSVSGIVWPPAMKSAGK